MLKYTLTFLFAILLVTTNASNYVDKNGAKYLPDRVIVKFKSGPTITSGMASLSKSTQNRMEALGINGYEQLFDAKSRNKESLNNIVELKVNSPMEIGYIVAKLSKLPEVEWAEPQYIYDLAFTPNDSLYNNQYSLQKINAEAAWDITKGSRDIVIAIVDTGVDWDHPDLAGNIWTNEEELNGTAGVDDDNNGYVDDIRGWDFGGTTGVADNNPMEDQPDHGTHVAGIVGAVTNNNTGVASIGYNCRIMAVKTAQDNIRDSFGRALISYGYQGIIYAVDNGAKVINCSWGSYSFSSAFQAVIDYAVANGVLLVGAAGNENNRDAIYPGNYKGALSVGYSNSQDLRDPSSNYGEKVDLFAPGSGIFDTWQNNTYAQLSGSSMASPLVAGIAGLVFTKFPEYSPLQVAEQIRVNADNIDNLNPSYTYLLGSGRANAYQSVSNTNSKSVRIKDVVFYDKGNGNGIFESGENVDVEVTFTNFLNPLSNLSVRLVTESPYIQLDNSSNNLGAQPTLSEFDNSQNLFSFIINPAAPLNTELSLRLEFSDGSYSDFQWTDEIIINPLYKTTSKNDINVTITSKGTIAYNDYPDNVQGDGFRYQDGADILFEGGLLYGNSAERMVSAVRDESGESQSDDFAVVQPFILQSPGNVADEQGLSIFDDTNAGSNRFSIETELHSYTFADDESMDFIILKYILKNTGSDNYSDLHAGLFFDWDIDASTSSDNLVNYNVGGRFGYAYNSDQRLNKTHAGVVLLSTDDDTFYAIDNVNDIYDGFTDAEKWTSLSNRRNHVTEGPSDISFVSGTGPHVLNADEQIEIAFALIAGTSLDELKDAASRSREKFASLVTDVNDDVVLPIEYSLTQNYPNPFNPTTTINYSIPNDGRVTIKVFDILGSEITTLVNKYQTSGRYSLEFNGTDLPSGLYICRMNAGNYSTSRKMLLIK